ncbi:type III secretion system inner membrane ring lipoprotein SctJ [Burkholderia sp. BE17]|uniref:type III secretion system inner membrane ring lipoprotein SctJ n=1 Tax=Burkholderia sp. BE17 TaxID=2656644 RepID=UPI00128B920E|nr:type III secretion inner membrane ring lipoprotein SctJ [Burkholderia sp. BE17]MPV71667.1 EscJ/YscJ/HrcJ family type III secretion inner membrane ring protein [Burkholderia sp. BE17]
MRRTGILILPLVALLLCSCKQQELLKNLTEMQANEAVAVLQAHGLSAQKSDQDKQGFRIDVAPRDFPMAVDLLRQYHLPSNAPMQIAQAFPADALVSSPLAERARLLSAVEQRLEQNLAGLRNVVSARVQVSYPWQSPNRNDTSTPMHASVLITYRNDVDEAILISKVKRFVRNSFTNASDDDISVILNPATPLFLPAPAASPDLPVALSWLSWPMFALVGAGLTGVTGIAWALLRRRRSAPEPLASDDSKSSADRGSRP